MLLYEICVRLTDGEDLYPFFKRGDIIDTKPAGMSWSWDLMQLESSEHAILRVSLVDAHVLELSKPLTWSLLLDNLPGAVLIQIDEHLQTPIDIDTDSFIAAVRRKEVLS